MYSDHANRVGLKGAGVIRDHGVRVCAEQQLRAA
jgi:hypothetical protein